MAGDDDRDRVGAVGGTDRTHGARAADLPGQVAVAAGGAVGNTLQGLPDFPLKRRTQRRQPDVEYLAFASEVFVQLARHFIQSMLRRQPFARQFPGLRGIHVQQVQALIVAGQQQWAKRAGLIAEIHGAAPD
ncbi:hypothetical protein D9M71_751910 [compost metagenome]